MAEIDRPSSAGAQRVSTRGVALLLLLALLALSGCGGGGGGGPVASLDDKLGYLPKDAPFVAVIETDIEGEQFQNINRLLSKFPFGGQLKNQIKKSISDSGADYEKDVKPLLGDELVVGSPDARSLVDHTVDDKFVVAFSAKDGGKLRDALKKDGSLRESGEVRGEKAYESQSDKSVIVVKGNTLVGASDRPTLEAALDRKNGGDKMTEAQFTGALGDLPESALVKVAGSVQGLLEADPSTAVARRIKWLAGLRTFGATVSVENGGIAIDARLNTQGVGEQDLPLAAGDEAPKVARKGLYTAAQRDIAHTIRWGLAALQAADPAQGSKITAQKDALSHELGIDVDQDVIAQFTGATTLTSDDGRQWAVRSEVKDPAAMEKTLATLVDKGRGGQLRFAKQDGLVKGTDAQGDSVYFGMVGGVFVGAKDPSAAKELASVQPEPVPGAKGSLVFIADGEQIAKQALQKMGGTGALGGQFFTGPIGDLTAWVASAPDGVRARVKLKVQ